MRPHLIPLIRSARERLTHLSHITALTLLAISSARLISNLRFLRATRRFTPLQATHLPCVSVLIPARNEAATIASCVTSLLQQCYPKFEVIVLDDGSTDGTSQQLDALQAEHPKLRVIHATHNPPQGWNGKSYACHRLAEQATGEWLLFTDADTKHSADSIERGIAQAIALNAELLSAFPFQVAKTWSERILVSFIMDFIPLLTVDFKAMHYGRSSRILANGQYLLVHAATYRQLGGHTAIAEALIDDFALAHQFRAAGQTVAVVDGSTMLNCRMYQSFDEVWNGFSKNLLNALATSTASSRTRFSTLLLALPFAWCYACLFVLPIFRLFFRRHRALAAAEVGWLFFLRWLAASHMRRPPGEILATPLAAWGVMAICTGAIFHRWRGHPIIWKGRSYFL